MIHQGAAPAAMATGTTATTATSAPRSDRPAALLHPRLDPWIAGWLATALWAAILLARHFDRLPAPTGWILWTAACVSAAHFAMSYRLAYDTPRTAVRAHPIALVWAPLALIVMLAVLLIAASLGSTFGGVLIRSMMTVVFALTMWHYIKQAYGVTMIAARHAGFELDRTERNALRFGLYPLWTISTLGYLAGRRLVTIGETEVRADLLNGPTGALRWVLVASSVAVLGATLIRATHRTGQRPPSAMIAPLVAAVLWVGAMPSAALAVILLPALHALQYLACAGRAQHRLLDREGRPPRETSWHVVQILLAAGCLGLLATSALPGALERVASPWDGLPLWPVTIFVALNLHHYLIDATVWRSDGRLVRAVIGPHR